MSTQPPILSIPFSITHPQQHVRLLELPPELLALIDAETNPDKATISIGTDNENDDDLITPQERHLAFKPLGGRVQLKSAPIHDEGSVGVKRAREEYLHVCTEDRVWSVRQVSTSNSVHMLRPGEVPVFDAGDDETNAATTSRGVTAFAQPTSTLELLPVKYTQDEVVDAIKRMLPVVGLDAEGDIPKSVDEKGMVADLPYPLYAILKAKRELCVIWPGNRCCIPEPEVLLAAWKALFSYNDEYPLDKSDLIGLGEYSRRIFQEEGANGELLACAVQAIGQRCIDEKEADLSELGRLCYSLEGRFKGKETAEFVGEMIVRSRGGKPIESNVLERQWVELVPESWRQFCRAEALLSRGASVDAKGFVSWHDDGGKEKVAEVAAPAATGKRNWHEKFAAQRKK